MRKAFIPTTLLASLILAAPAAARPTIDESRASTYHDARLAKSVAAWNDEAAQTNTSNIEANEAAGYPVYGPDDFLSVITDFSTEPCEAETKFRALCGYTLHYDDGSSCEGENDVIVKRNGKYRVVWGWDDEDCTS